jgi:hypothetical protein
MKRNVLILALIMFVSTAFAATNATNTSVTLSPSFEQVEVQTKLSLKERIALKFAKKALKKETKENGADISKGMYILLAVVGLGWLAMGLLDDFEGSGWIVCLILYALLWLPGFIYSLIKMKNYY